MSGFKIEVELTEVKLKELIAIYISNETGQDIDPKDVDILVKSKQNYRSEWESASFKAIYRNFK